MTLYHNKYGNNAEYRIIHVWVRKMLGKPQRCELCGDDSPRMYHWANISGNYLKDVNDWRSLCVPCHHRENNPGKCKHGHEMTDANTYIRPTGYRVCRTCKRADNLRFKAKIKALKEFK